MPSTLTSAPVAPLLASLYADAARTSAELRATLAALPADARARLLADPDYRALYGRAAAIHMPVAPATGALLYALARTARARAIVEFGTSFGISTIHLAAALRDNGGGRVIGTEFEPTKLAAARANLAAAGLADLVDLRAGDALETLATDLPAAIDLVLLDGHKPLYADVLARLEPHLRPGACVVADNADACPAYLARVRDPAAGYVTVALTDDVALSIRTGG